MIPILLDIVSTLENDFSSWLNQLIGGLIQIFLNAINGLANIFLGAIDQVIGGILGFFGVPFSAWSHYVAQNGGWFIPIIFVAILGIAFLIAEGINIVYGFEKDIGGAEGDINAEETHLAEEAEE